MANLLELAELSNAVYNTADLKRKAAVVVAGHGKWSCTDYKLASGSMNGFQAGMFVKGGQKVVAFRGTAQAMDGVADLKLGTGMNSSYFYEGEEFAAKSGVNTIVTGHSLGGAIAQIVANRGDYVMATFNAPGVGVIASRNILNSTPLMNTVRVGGMLTSLFRHPMQAGSDIWNAFNVVKGVNICLNNDAVSQIGNHYGKVRRIAGTSMNPLTEHSISTVIDVLKKNKNIGLKKPGSF